MVVFVVLAFFELVAINVNMAPEALWARWTLAGIFVLAAVFGWRFFVKASHKVARNFTAALEVDDRLAKISREVTFSVPEDTIGNVVIPEGSPSAGKTIGSLNIRAKTGATVITVARGNTKIRNVGPRLEVLVGDTLVAIGDEEQIARLREMVEGGQ